MGFEGQLRTVIKAFEGGGEGVLGLRTVKRMRGRAGAKDCEEDAGAGWC